MPVSGMRAAAAVRDAMHAAGLGFGGRPGRGVEGWAGREYHKTVGFGLVPVKDGSVRWCVHLAGKPHLRYVTEGAVTEPERPDALHPRIAQVFARLGMDVRGVSTSGWQTMWDDDVSYDVTTARPEWLAGYDRGNAVSPHAPGPVLQCLELADTDHGLMVGRVRLAGYADGATRLLTRESVERFVTLHAEGMARNTAYLRRPDHRDVRFAEDGTLTILTVDYHAHNATPTTVVNHWGDEVEAWPVPNRLFRPVLPFAPEVPFTVAGETRTTLSFAEWDVQHGDDTPWAIPAPSRSPAP